MQSTNIFCAVLPGGCRSPKCHHASALQLTSRNRDSSANKAELRTLIRQGIGEHDVEYRRYQTSGEVRATQSQGRSAAPEGQFTGDCGAGSNASPGSGTRAGSPNGSAAGDRRTA